MAISDFSKKTPKNGNFWITSSKSNIFKVFKKCAICCRTRPGHIACQISVWYIYFGKHIAQKSYSSMTSFFQTAFLSISRHRTEIKMTFFGILRSNRIGNTHCYSEISIRKLNLIWPGVGPTLVWHWLAWRQIAERLQFF